jgi:hypothetical protein
MDARRSRFRIMALALAVALLPAGVFAQATNPAVRGASTTPRVATQNRATQVSERMVTAASPFAAACGDRNGTVYIGAEVEPHVAVNPLNPNHLVGAWQQDRYSNGAARGQVSGASFDGGLTWSFAPTVVTPCTGGSYERATDPWITFAPDGTVYQAALGVSGSTFNGVSAILVSRSSDGGLTWGAPATLVRDTVDLYNDKETITADPLDARFVYAVWDRLRRNVGAPTLFARSIDAGASWEPARAIYDPGNGRQTIGNLIRVLPDGTLVNVFMHLVIGSTTAPTIQVIHSIDRGATWSEPVFVATAAALGARDPATGSPIRDGAIVPQMAVAPDGTLYVVWQDARFTQVRDSIALSRSTDGGLTWSAPVRVNADPNVWAFTPQVHVRADGTVGVTYYDLRSDTADPATLWADFWLARSIDAVNWSETRVSPPFDLALAPIAGGYFLGDYTGLVSSGTSFISLYAKTTGDLDNRNDVFAARIGSTGTLAAQKRILAEESVVPTYRAQSLPAWAPGAEFWREVAANAERAIERRQTRR